MEIECFSVLLSRIKCFFTLIIIYSYHCTARHKISFIFVKKCLRDFGISRPKKKKNYKNKNLFCCPSVSRFSDSKNTKTTTS